MRAAVPAATVVLLATLVGLAAAADAPTTDWPQWRGPTRDGVAPPGVTLPARLPTELRRVWRVEVGLGHASPIVAGDRVFVHTRVGDDEVMRGLSLTDGSELWSYSVATPYRRNPAAMSHDKGPKSTPVAAGSSVCALGITGRLTCFDVASGAVRWQNDFSDRYQKTYPDFGAAMSPAVVGGKLVAHVGGDSEGALTAFDLDTGEVAWAWDLEGPGYASPVEVSIDGVAQLVTQSRGHIVAVERDTGRELWKTAFSTPYDQNIVTPLVHGSRLILSGLQASVFAIDPQRDGRGSWLARRAWTNEELPMYMSSPVLRGDLAFGFSHMRKGQLFCIDVDSGSTMWTDAGRGGDNAALILVGSEAANVGDLLVVQTTGGELIVAAADGSGYRELARYTVADSATWAHPALIDRGILVKDAEHLTLWAF